MSKNMFPPRLGSKARERLANKLYERSFELSHDILRVTGDDGRMIPTLSPYEAGFVSALRTARDALMSAAELIQQQQGELL